MKHQFSPKVKELRQKKSIAEAELNMIPQQRKAIRVKIDDFEAKGKTLIEQRQQELNTRQLELAHSMTEAQAHLEKMNADKQKQITAAQKKYDEAKRNNEKGNTERVEDIRAETKLREKEAEAELMKLRQMEVEELKGRGADTALVEDCKAKILSSENELRYIEQHRKLVYDYRHDKEELFDQEENLKTLKRMLADKLSQLTVKNARGQQKNDGQVTAIAR